MIASAQIQIPMNNLFKFHYGPMDSLRIGANIPLYICMYVCVRIGIRGKFLLNKKKTISVASAHIHISGNKLIQPSLMAIQWII